MLKIKKFLNSLLSFIVLSYLSLAYGQSNGTINVKPIIGILTIPTRGDFYPYYPSTNYTYIDSTYAKYIQGAGARVAVIPYDLPQDQILSLLKSINGLFIQGGDYQLWETNSSGERIPTQLFMTLHFIINQVLQWNLQGDYFPLWGCSEGMNVILIIIANDPELLEKTPFLQKGKNINLEFVNENNTSKLYSLLNSDLFNYIQEKRSFWIENDSGINLSKFLSNTAISNILNPLTIIRPLEGDDDAEYITSAEGKQLIPIYLVAYHPEINIFNWGNPDYVHTFESIKASQRLIFKYVNDSRSNTHSFDNQTYENSSLIINYNLTVMPETNQAIYFFPRIDQKLELKRFG